MTIFGTPLYPGTAFLRVGWFIWAKDVYPTSPATFPGLADATVPLLPHGYDPQREILPTNDVDIINALNVAGKITLEYWSEDKPVPQLSDLYWRRSIRRSTMYHDEITVRYTCGFLLLLTPT